MPGKEEPKPYLELDPKTKAVFDRKGYDIKKRLAGGAFGDVYLAIKKDGNKKCAVKVMDLGNPRLTDRVREEFLPRELAALIQMKHPNAIEIYDIFKSRNRIYIFMEFAPNGTIADYLKDKGPLEEPLAAMWFKQSSDALNYMHEEIQMAHRDIKIENILLGTNNQAKLTDFGFATKVEFENGRPKMSKTWCGTVPYYSPQIVAKQPYNPFADDVWAMGVCLFNMVTNRHPFHFQKNKKIMHNEQMSRTYRLEPNASKELKDLLWRMFDPEERSRYTMKQVLDSDFIRKKAKSH